MSATRLDDGGWSIDPSELFRVYEPLSKLGPDENGTDAHRPGTGREGQDAPSGEGARPPFHDPFAVELLERQITDLRERLAEMKEAQDDARRERDAWRDTANAAVNRPLMLPAPDDAGHRRDPRPWWRRLAG